MQGLIQAWWWETSQKPSRREDPKLLNSTIMEQQLTGSTGWALLYEIVQIRNILDAFGYWTICMYIIRYLGDVTPSLNTKLTCGSWIPDLHIPNAILYCVFFFNQFFL